MVRPLRGTAGAQSVDAADIRDLDQRRLSSPRNEVGKGDELDDVACGCMVSKCDAD